MTIEDNSLRHACKKILASISLLFLCSTPAFYVIVSLDMMDNVYMTARALRLFVVVIIGCVIRKENREAFAHHVPQRKQVFMFTLGCIFVSIWLQLNNTTSRIYGTISYTIGIYNLETTPLFLSVLWEQLFAGDLYWSILLGLVIVFFSIPVAPQDKGAVLP